MVLHYLFIMGICVEAMTGAIAAGRKRMDFFGVIMIACITALGGGSVRDALFNTHPMTWVAHPQYLLYTSLFAIFTILLAQSLIRVMKVFLILDALGLATFVVVGTEKILSHGYPASVAVISGLITGISGGMLRDILCNDIPLVLRKELYAVIALAGSVFFISLDYLQIPHEINVVVTLLCIFVARLLAIFLHIEMPKFDYANSIKKRNKH